MELVETHIADTAGLLQEFDVPWFCEGGPNEEPKEKADGRKTTSGIKLPDKTNVKTLIFLLFSTPSSKAT